MTARYSHTGLHAPPKIASRITSLNTRNPSSTKFRTNFGVGIAFNQTQVDSMFSMDWPHTHSPSFRDHLHRYPFLHPKLKQGHGLGWSSEYKPWVTITKVKDGEGRTSHVFGYKTHRIHHVLSLHEISFLYLAERWPWVTDIREQWPILDFDRTNELHYERGIGVPKRNGAPQPVTIDFLLTEQTEDGIRCRAIAVKPEEKAKRPKTNLYLDVQRVWCEENGIPFSVVQNTGGLALCETLTEIRKWFDDGYKPCDEQVLEFATCFTRGYQENTPLTELFNPICKSLRVDETEAFSLFRYCAWSNRIQLDLQKPIALDEAVVLSN